MTKLTANETSEIRGNGFWSGFGCGVALGAAMVEGFLNPLVDLAAVAACGAALSE